MSQVTKVLFPLKLGETAEELDWLVSVRFVFETTITLPETNIALLINVVQAPNKKNNLSWKRETLPKTKTAPENGGLEY